MPQAQAQNFWADAPVISRYTRAQAIEDGYLIDVSELAREAGITWPVAVTSALWAVIEDIPTGFEYQDTTGRLWDILNLLTAIIRNPYASSIAYRRTATDIGYKVILYHYEDRTHVGGRRKHRIKYQRIRSVSGPGDNGEPVITLGTEGDPGW